MKTSKMSNSKRNKNKQKNPRKIKSLKQNKLQNHKEHQIIKAYKIPQNHRKMGIKS